MELHLQNHKSQVDVDMYIDHVNLVAISVYVLCVCVLRWRTTAYFHTLDQLG